MEHQLDQRLDPAASQIETLQAKLRCLEAIQRKTEYRLDEAQKLAKIGFWELDLIEDELFWSEEIYRIFNIQPDKFSSTYEAFLEFVHPEDRNSVNEAFINSLRNQQPFDIVHRLLFKDGTVKYVHEHCRTLFSDQGIPVRALGTVQDISELKAMEQHLQQSHKLESVGRLAAGVAHEINNILTGILGYCELAMIQHQDDANLNECLTQIFHAGEQAANVVQQLLTFGRKKVSHPKLFDLHKAVAQLKQLLQKMIGEDIHIQTLLQAQESTILADQSLVEQAIVNLVINARDAMPHGGKIILRTKNEMVQGPEPLMLQKIILSVEDEGVGIPPGELQSIFQPFYTTKASGKGTGLGLSIVKDILEQHNASIDVSSTVNKGTTFYLSFDTKSEQPSEASMDLYEEYPRGKEHILVVDDDATVRSFTEFVLQSYGYSCTVAANGNEAIKKVEKHLDNIDLILSDVILPGMNGREMAKILKQHNPKLALLLMSSYPTDVIEGAGVNELEHDLIHKPLKPSILLKRLRRALDSAA